LLLLGLWLLLLLLLLIPYSQVRTFMHAGQMPFRKQ
jgi:hypothetical protein